MTDVKHMKWWGWGVEGVAFNPDNKPAFAPFVKKAVGLDLSVPAVPAVAFGDLTLPSSTIDAAFLATLAGIVGEANTITDDEARLVHTYGKSIRDLLRIRASDLPRMPDVVVYPADEAQVAAVVTAAVAANAVIIPFGGGSNISGSLEPHPGEARVVISLDLGLLNKVTLIDEGSGLASIQAGAQGPFIEEQLNARGWTMGHFPDSFTHSTLGGWVATRSSGMQSDKYGDIADIARGIRMVRPAGIVDIRPVPSASTGPSVREMILGSEGRLGVITEVTVQVHRTPEVREINGYLFPSWEAGIAAMHDIAESDAKPTVTRVSDARESGFSFATGKAKEGFDPQKVLMAYLKRRGWDLEGINLSFIGFEGSPSHVAYEKKIVKRIVKKHGGLAVGKGPGVLYDQKKFDTPYLRDFLLDRGAAADVSETAAPWSRLNEIHDAVYAAANDAYEQIGTPGWIMSHLSHSYHSGACLYFTFAFVHGGEIAIEQYDVVKRAIQQAFVDHGGTISHHHGVGREHAPWLEQDISTEGVALMAGLFASADPKKNFNPDKVITY
ncbi:alkyldihydroxyacetonephosphate synthase [Conyzicola lurida]|uniref:Alkyldihydroxyacetonephosphate synthase n=1 Tax=Conyzicola lurida TaxID=1172621 RepID=A0A841ARB2_9MICO|nr:FAD-binding oxidoreductase [Conyzicola lurida]MBB5844123.1 alkyldihydroxyacetonephosphate synthase [Conyzicola lurida]